MQIEPDARHDMVLIDGGEGVGLTLHIAGLGPQQFFITRAALVGRLGAVSSDEGLLAACRRGIVDIEAAAEMKIGTSIGDVTVLDVADFPQR
ncbi:DUF1488 domain-containing protein [Pigmentiphaga aceris]|uniref:DUF1488 domain-containing protein n=1 Tax=Pigmentiphaga aceris TaxID=1940612 RepID=A0A5C0AUS0_9BURK|nr:DUF1488 domain-containing protein [Pigmentiphaga aceris]QEI06078.1 DUF1488 domain-containing protein [Pigmentiphaga aceris]